MYQTLNMEKFEDLMRQREKLDTWADYSASRMARAYEALAADFESIGYLANAEKCKEKAKRARLLVKK